MTTRRTGLATDSLVCDDCGDAYRPLREDDDPDAEHQCPACALTLEEREAALEAAWRAEEGG